MGRVHPPYPPPVFEFITIMAKVKPPKGLNPGFSRLAPTAFNDVRERADTITIRGNDVSGTAVDFVLDGRVVASLFDGNNGLSYIILEDEDNRTLGSFIEGDEANLAFPKSGEIRSVPTGRTGVGAVSKRTYEIHDVKLSKVKFKQFTKQ